MTQQTEENLVQRIDTLQTEIHSLEQELEAARKAKSSYCAELANDPAVVERRLEQLASGFAVEHVREFTDEQLSRVKELMDSIRAIENTIRSHHETIEQLEKTIAAQQRRQAAEAAIKEPIENFNRSLAELKRIWESLKEAASEHDVEIQQQEIPGAACLFERRPRQGYSPYVHWLTIGFEKE